MISKIPVALAAAMMQKTEQFVRIGLQRNLLPFGTAVAGGHGARPRYSYYISPTKFMDFTGFSEDAIRAYADKMGIALHTV